MITATRITRALGVLGVVGFLAHATTSLATSGATYQDPAAPEPVPAASALDAAPLPTAPEPIDDLPPAPDEPLPAPAPAPKPEEPPAAKIEAVPAPKPEAPAPPPAASGRMKELPPVPDEPVLDPVEPPTEPIIKPEPLMPLKPGASPAPLPAEAPSPRPATRKPAPRWEPAIDDAPEAEDDRPAARASGGIPASPLATSDDPDAQARTFLERNRREAEGQLKALRDEAAQLKARLARVEAGIRRWEGLADALDRGAQDLPQPAAASRAPRSSHPAVQYGVPVPTSEGVIIQSRPLTRSDFVPVPQPR